MLFLFEYASCTRDKLPPSIAVEGLAMFKALKEGIEGEVYSFVNPEHLHHFKDFPVAKELEEDFSAALEKCDSALIVAPESEDLLYTLTEKVERAGVENLGSSSRAVRVCSDKYETLKRLKGLRGPETEIFKGTTSLDFPVVAKPRVGEGGEGIFLVKDEEELDKVPTGYLLQEYIPGLKASASLFASEERLDVVSLQTQIMKGFSYTGGEMPLELENREILLEAADKIEGLRGFFGIDFVINNGEIVFMEINPRVTTPIIGFKKAYGITFQDLLEGKFPERAVKTEIRKIKGKAENPFISTGDYSIVLRRFG